MSHAEQGFAPPRPALEPYERDAGDKPPFVLSLAEIKLLGITGVSSTLSLLGQRSNRDACSSNRLGSSSTVQ